MTLSLLPARTVYELNSPRSELNPLKFNLVAIHSMATAGHQCLPPFRHV